MKSPLTVARSSLAASLLVAALAAAGPAHAATPFSSPFHFDAGTTPSAVAVGDLTGNGFQDLVTTDGGCPPPPPYTTPPPCTSAGPAVWVRLGGPLGTFGAAVPYSVAGDPSSPVIGDFLGNGEQAVAVIDEAGIQVLPVGRLGVLGSPVTLPAPNAPLNGTLVAGDFDGGGVSDLAAADNDDAIEVWLGNGHGGFDAPESYPFGEGIGDLAVGDFNGDGDADLAISWSRWVPSGIGGSNYPELSILFGNGHGGVSSREDLTPPTTEASAPGQLAVGDLTGDGDLDIVDTAPSGQIAAYLGNGHGGFGAPVLTTVPGAGDLTSPELADFDGSGHLGLAVLDWESGSCCSQDATAYELSGDGHGGFVDPESLSTGGDAQGLAVDDFLGDGRPDIAALNAGYISAGPTVTAAPNAGVEIFYDLTPPAWWPASAASAWPGVLAQWASGQWPSQLAPWDVNAWLPLPPGPWGSSVSAIVAAARSAG